MNLKLYSILTTACNYSSFKQKKQAGLEMNTQISGNEIINLLKAEKSYLIKEFGVVTIGLFGSFARGQSVRDSDIDLIVELKEPKFDYLAGLQVYLEKKFSRKIEIVRKDNKINSRFTKRVEKDVIYA